MIKEFGRPEYEKADRRQPAANCRCCRTSWSMRSASGTSRSARRRRSNRECPQGSARMPIACGFLASRQLASSALSMRLRRRRQFHEGMRHDDRCARFPRTAARRLSRDFGDRERVEGRDLERQARRIHRAARAVRLRQVDRAQLHRRSAARSPAAASGSTRRASTRCRRRTRGFGMVFQNYALFPHMTRARAMSASA